MPTSKSWLAGHTPVSSGEVCMSQQVLTHQVRVAIHASDAITPRRPDQPSAVRPQTVFEGGRVGGLLRQRPLHTATRHFGGIQHAR
jgi:hypothetical protein